MHLIEGPALIGSRDDAFDPAPRPTKRRRLVLGDIEDDEQRIEPLEPSKQTAKPRRGRPKKLEAEHVPSKPKQPRSPKPKKPPKSKHRIHVHHNGADLEDQVYSQELNTPSSPGHLRGAIWIRKPSDSRKEIGRAVERGDFNDTTNGFNQTNKSDISDESAFETLRSTINAMKKASSGDFASPHRKDSVRSTCRSPVTGATETAMLPPNDFDVEKELADLPSDAFISSSSSPQKSPQKQQNDTILLLSSQPPDPQQEPQSVQARPNLAAPHNGLRQMNLFGSVAQHHPANTQQVPKVHNWPRANKDEPPTHHRLDREAMRTWVYPTNLGTIRDYQFNIVARGLFHNLLVALPTGLGKTFIAATVMLNWFRWTTDSQIVFVAPTKPLVSQQVEACFGIAGIPRSQTSMLTGGIQPGLRAEEWSNKRVFFMTPQTIVNDLKTGICDPKKIVLLVVDEAHRATGAYAYVEVVKFIRRFNQSFRVLALTATPGNTVEAVQEVINGLDIARVEIRTERSLDIRHFVHSRKTENQVFDNSPEMGLVMDFFSKAVQPVLNKLNQHNAYWIKEPMMLTAYGLTQARQKWMVSAGKNAEFAVKGMVNRIFSVLASLAHSVDLLKYHGIGPFYNSMVAFRNSQIGVKGGKYEGEILHSEPFQKMMTRLQFWMNSERFIGHPKLEYLQEVTLNHFVNAGEDQTGAVGGKPAPTRIMVFAHYRDSAEEIVRVLSRHKPMIRAHVFVGQAASKGTEGMDQRKQLEIINEFKKGTYNTLVATSIGEEGLDIGEIDLIICYDSSASPIRMLQRMGRTGRKRAGNIILLLMRGKEENSFMQAKDSYEKMQGMIVEGKHFEFHEDRSPRILPKEAQPIVEKRAAEIPVENTQAELPELTRRRGRAPKRPPKRFHMPNGVRTGFMRASRMGASDGESDAGGELPEKRQTRGQPRADLTLIPALEDVLLSPDAEREFNVRYGRVADGSDGEVCGPENTLHPERQRSLTSTKFVGHGQAARRMARTLQSIRSVDEATVERWERIYKTVDVDALCGPVPTVDEPIFTARKADARPPVAKRTPGQRLSRKTPSKKPARRGAKRQRPAEDEDGAAEGACSSPPATDPCLAMPSQGINLGTSDTSGAEELEEEADTELEDFIVGSDQPDGTAPTLSSSPVHVGQRNIRSREKNGATAEKPSEQTPLSLEVDRWERELRDVEELGKVARTTTASETEDRSRVSKQVGKRRARVLDSDDDDG